MNKTSSASRSILLVALLVVGFALATTLRAQVIATYNIAAADAFESPTVAGTPAANVSASPLSAIGVSPLSSDIGVNGHFLWSTWEASGTVNPNDNYFSFTITPNLGFQVNYTTVTYSVAAFETAGWQLRSSVDGYTANFGAHTIVLDGTQNPFTDTVSSIGTQTGPVTFRLYGYSNTAGGASDFDGLANNNGFFGPAGSGRNVVVGGTVSAVPEPHQYAIIAGLGLLGFAAYRQRSRHLKLG